MRSGSKGAARRLAALSPNYLRCFLAEDGPPPIFLADSAERLVTTEKIVIAVGTHAAQDPNIPLDEFHAFSSDDILTLDELPQSLTIIGAGVIGCEYASIFAELGVRVTLIDMRPRLLPFVDAEMVDLCRTTCGSDA